MQTGHVRAILADHLRSSGSSTYTPSDDPGALVSAAEFAAHLDHVRAADGDAALRHLAHDYVHLWRRTFRTLVKQLRGRPERTLQLWCDEVYPFLRGDRHPVRLIRRSRTEANVTMGDDLPAAYLCGLLEAFVGLSGAETNATPIGRGTYRVTHHLHPQDQTARMVHWVAGLRIPLLVTAGLSVLLGAAASFAAMETPAATGSFLATTTLLLVGAIATQSGANALHDLRKRVLGPLAVVPASTGWRWFQLIGSYTVATGTLIALMLQGHLWLPVVAFLGLGVGIAYAQLRNQGFGPFLAAITHGPLMVATTMGVLAPTGGAFDWFTALALSAVPGLLTATMLYVDDMADRPIDQAGGRRTMAVRLPPTRNLLVLATTSIAAVLISAWISAWTLPLWTMLWMLPSLGIAAALVRESRRNLDDPHGLARARITAIGLHLITTLLLTTLILQGALQ